MNSLNRNIRSNVEHDKDTIVLIDSQLSGRSGDINTVGLSSVSLHAARVPGGIKMDLGESFWEYVDNIREHNIEWLSQ